MSTCICHPRSAPDQDRLAHELEITEAVLAQGDLPHARHHLAGAFGLSPTDPRTLALFEAFAARADLTPRVGEGPEFYGDLAVRAFALHRAGRRDEGIGLLVQVAATMPHLGYEHALTAWIAEGPLTEETRLGVARLLGVALNGTIGLHRLLPGERALLISLAEVGAAVVRQGDPGPAAPMVSGMLRRVGRIDEALAVAERAEGADGCIQKGLALRARGDGAGALAAFDAAARLDGDSYAAERARCLFVLHDHAGVTEQLAGVHFNDDPELLALAEAATRAPDPAVDPVDQLDAWRREAVTLRLAPPSDATANIFASLPSGHQAMSVAVTGWESPSNRLLVALLDGTDDPTAAAYAAELPPLPRDPTAQVRGHDPAWHLVDGVLVQALPRPPAALVARLAAAASDVTALDDAWRAGAALAATLRPEDARDLVAALVYPPTDAGWASLPEGLYRYQVVGACALASLPRDVALPRLESLVFGPVDWISGAAASALGELAHHDAASAFAARALLLDAVADLLPSASEPRFSPLLHALSGLPAVPPSALAKLRAWHAENIEGPDAPSEETATPATPATPSKPPARHPFPGNVSPWYFVVIAVALALTYALR